MFIDSTNNDEETYWSKNPSSNNNKPGPYRFVISCTHTLGGGRGGAMLTSGREYYIIKSNGAASQAENTATYCGAYAHKDLSSNGDFVVCS